MSEKIMASAVQIKNYFQYAALPEFSADWKKCTAGDRAEIADLVGTEIETGRWVPPVQA